MTDHLGRQGERSDASALAALHRRLDFGSTCKVRQRRDFLGYLYATTGHVTQMKLRAESVRRGRRVAHTEEYLREEPGVVAHLRGNAYKQHSVEGARQHIEAGENRQRQERVAARCERCPRRGGFEPREELEDGMRLRLVVKANPANSVSAEEIHAYAFRRFFRSSRELSTVERVRHALHIKWISRETLPSDAALELAEGRSSSSNSIIAPRASRKRGASLATPRSPCPPTRRCGRCGAH